MPKKLNMNDIAVRICEMEGGVQNLPISQVKEVLKCFGKIYIEEDLIAVWWKYCQRVGK